MSNSLSAFGFLTAVEDEIHGFFGGYLVLSELGRPLEFHCTTPILPSPAQRILYGSTLRSYVLGEIIGQTLIRQAQLPVQAVLTDLEDMLSLSLLWQGVLAWVSPLESWDVHHDPTDLPGDPSLELANSRYVGSSTCNWLPANLQSMLEPLLSYIDVMEPFQRIHQAIQEAQRVTESPTEENDDSLAA